MKKIASGTELLNPEEILRTAGIEQGMKVGAFGSGNGGFFALQAAELVGKDGRVYAFDVRKDALESVENKARFGGILNLDFVWTDLEEYGAAKRIPDASLDLGLLVNTLHETEDRRAAMRECIRMIKPGGTLLVVDWERSASLFGPPPERRVHPDILKEMAGELDLDLDREFKAGQYHYGLLFKKHSHT
ncbi:MAG: class I SAM-dependent methyltransferase [bacterium]|nr:class I SAM-dependent methyltransferase [bacterium]